MSIAAGRVYTMGHDPKAQKDTVYCIDAETGKEVWTHSFSARTMAKQHRGGTLTTPSVDGGHVFVSNREGKLLCLDAQSGKAKWSQDLTKTYGLKVSEWGFAASPLVLDDVVILNVGRVLALGKDGRLRWKSDRNYDDCYSTPVDFVRGDRRLLAVFNAVGLAILELKSGKEIALHKWGTRPMTDNVNAPTPVVIGDRIFISSGYRRGCAMLEFGDQLKPVWQSRVMNNSEAGCVHFEGHLYGFDRSTFKCLDLDGKVKWSKRLGKGAFSVADGKLVLLTVRGELVIADATPEAFRELSRAHVLDGGVNWSSPVVCAGLIYCRNSLGDLVCRDHR